MTTETHDQFLQQAERQHRELREKIAALQQQLLGLELIRAAGEAELAGGYANVFGAADARPHDNWLLVDAIQIANLWSYSHSADDFARRMADHRMATVAGELAVESMIEHWDAIQPKLLPFKDAKEQRQQDE
ncbi:hypothetical protein [Pseudomonas sp. HY7a-MNA-CIBAN-0227]|uniref:hypothetical protein n=1 Tax=Pseudomonas sp. HY7a-MNA-CIBAN-0227 TaxID=3140474 RepID=UPI003333B92C